MSAQECTNENVPRTAAAERRVRDVMVARPKTLPASVGVGELRALFANPHVRTALLVDGVRFAGTVDRDAVPVDAADDRPAGELARRDVATIGPDAPVSEALALMDAAGARRLVVVDSDGATLRGLLCLTVDRSGYCQSG
jgi:predicted transcriptional regulator